MFIAIIHFESANEDAAANERAVRDIIDQVVSKQPGFVRARVHRGTGPSEGMVVNYMEWQNSDAFYAFRERHGPEVTKAVGRFNPRFTFHEIAHEIGTWSLQNAA